MVTYILEIDEDSGKVSYSADTPKAARAVLHDLQSKMQNFELSRARLKISMREKALNQKASAAGLKQSSSKDLISLIWNIFVTVEKGRDDAAALKDEMELIRLDRLIAGVETAVKKLKREVTSLNSQPNSKSKTSKEDVPPTYILPP